MGEEVKLSDADRAHMRSFLKLIFERNPSMVNRWEMNEAVFDIVAEMVDEVVQCSDTMDLVPRPSDLVIQRGTKHYVREVLRRIAKRVARNQTAPRRRIYISCRNFLAANYRPALDIAGAGL